MGLMDKAIADTVKDNKDFKKSNLKELASRKRQVGGNHYKNFKIQPVDYIMQNDLTFLEGNVIKYTPRARKKNGIEDYEKAKHCIELLIEHAKEHGHE